MIQIDNINKIKKLIKDQCASYNTQDNFCFQYDKTCLFFTDNERCKYFEESVLPIDSELEQKYWDKHDDVVRTTQKAKPKSRIKCQRCGAIFEANSNRQKYCDKCKKIIQREQSKNSMKKKRNNI